MTGKRRNKEKNEEREREREASLDIVAKQEDKKIKKGKLETQVSMLKVQTFNALFMVNRRL